MLEILKAEQHELWHSCEDNWKAHLLLKGELLVIFYKNQHALTKWPKTFPHICSG